MTGIWRHYCSMVFSNTLKFQSVGSSWASCQIWKIAGCACAGNAGNVFFRPSMVSDLDMHHGTCVAHVPWCMPGSSTSGFLWSRWRGKRSRHSRRKRNPQFDVSGYKRPMVVTDVLVRIWHLDISNNQSVRKYTLRLPQRTTIKDHEKINDHFGLWKLPGKT